MKCRDHEFHAIDPTPIDIPKLTEAPSEGEVQDIRSAIVFAPHTDLGNAQRLITLHGKRIRYVIDRGSFITFNGRRWVFDEDGEIVRLAADTIRTLYRFADIAEHPDAIRGFARFSEAKPRLAAMIALAKTLSGVPIRMSALDANPLLFSAGNCSIDLKTGEARAHRREDLIVQGTEVPYDMLATCPRWLQFIEEITGGDAALAGYLKRLAGYSLTALTKEQAIFFFVGEGRNGKSLFLEILRMLLGSYGRAADFSTFLERKGEAVRNDLARLCGARLVTASEMEEGKYLDESVVKQFTGGDTIAARFLYKEHFEYVPRMKIILATNHRPLLRGSHFAMRRRVRIVPFNVVIPPEKNDRDLKEKLRAESAGILRWAVEGCLEWQAERLGLAPMVAQATTEFFEFNDWLREFLDACCELAPEAQVAANDLYQAYRSWARDAGQQPLARNAFGMALRDRGFTHRRSSSTRFWSGLQLRAAPVLE
jgi:putative DNA primase/helicase